MDSSSSSIIDDRIPEMGIMGRGHSRPMSSVFQGGAKRALDLIGAGGFLIAFFPLLLGIVALVFLVQGRPIFYGHSRVGRGGRSFKCYKFRTMVREGERVLAAYLAQEPQARREWEATRKLKDDPRVTPLGRTLRKLSIDELPQFFNVLLGDMSLVGPRPIVDSETRYYGPHVDLYYSVRPGITGVWQVSGRSQTTYESRVSMDIDYVASWTLKKDLAILVKTVPAVLASKGSW